MSSLLDLHAKLTIDTSGYEQGLENAERQANQFGNTSNQSGQKVKKLGPLTVAAGNLIAAGIKKAGSAMINFGKSSINSSITAETAMAKVSTIMDDTVVSTDEMQTSIMDLSSRFGTSVGDIADSVYDVISATGDTANAVSLVEQATMLAKGGFAETGDAVSVLTTAINAYGLEMTDAQKISDSLITVQNLGVTTVGELSSQMGKAIATGAAYGVNLGNLETGYIALTKAGIGTAEATTYMSSMMNELGDSGSDVSAILQEKTGKSFGELMEDGNSLGDVLGILNEAVDGDSEALMNLWGSAEAGKAASAIVNQGLEEFNGWLNEVEDSAGATQSAYETMSDTTADKISQLKTSFENLSTEAIEPIRQKLEDFIPKITEAIQSVDIEAVKSKISELAPIIEGVGIAIGIVTAAITMYNIVQAVKLAMEAAEVTTLGGLIAAEAGAAAGTLAAIAPFLLVAAAIAAAIAAGVLIIQNWDKIKAKAAEIVQAVTQKFTELKTNVVNKVNELKTAVSNKFTEVKTDITNKAEAIKTGVVNKFESLKSDAVSKINTLKSNISSSFDSIKTKITETIGNAKQTFDEKIEAIKSTAKGIFDGIVPRLHLSLPHVSVSGGSPPWGIAGRGQLPSFSVTWNRKAMNVPYLLDGATIFGINDNGLLGGGEAGKEVIYGHESLMNDIRNATSGDDKSAEAILAYLVNGGLVEDIIKALEETDFKIDGREFGRMVREYA